MLELFNPTLPGRVIEVGADQMKPWVPAGWRTWDQLSEDEQAAHTEAVRAAETFASAVRDLAETAAAGSAQIEAMSTALGTLADAPKPTAQPDKTPTDGDTPKEK